MKRNLAGTWHSQHGSVLTFEISPEGVISGTFRSATGLAKNAPACKVAGFVSGDLVTFIVDFGQYDSLTAWTGHVVVSGSETRIDTQWQMAVALPARGAAGELWKGTWTGADVFRRAAVQRETEEMRIGSHPMPSWP